MPVSGTGSGGQLRVRLLAFINHGTQQATPAKRRYLADYSRTSAAKGTSVVHVGDLASQPPVAPGREETKREIFHFLPRVSPFAKIKLPSE